MSDSTRALAALLADYADPDPEQAGRLDVPATVAAQALRYLLPEQATARLNLVHPPLVWLVEQAEHHAGGRLVGALARGRTFVVFDGIQLPAASGRALAQRVLEAWGPETLEAAVAEAWATRESTSPMWTGTGTDLLAGPPPGATWCGVWWD